MIKIFKKGFTLIELLVVITIIGILTAVATTNLSSARSRARDARRKSDLRSIEQALRLYYNDYKAYPQSDADFQIMGCTSGACSWGGTFSNGTGPTTYMSRLPLDPSSSTGNTITYKYLGISDDEYLIVATLENLSDPDISESQTQCSSSLTQYTESVTTDYVVCIK
jgi:type II secretion system protein G